MPAGRRRIVLVTGLSGAGRSTSLKALEDLGYEAVDNLPLSLVGALVEPLVAPDHVGRSVDPDRPLAVGLDARTRDFDTASLAALVGRLGQRADVDVRLVFLDCADEVLQRRFTETRRRHPLAIDRPVADGIARERALLARLRDVAGLTIDTTELSIHDLRRLLAAHFGLGDASGLFVFVTSFSFRRGVPRDADLVFDVRFLDNPHYVEALRPLTGRDPAVAAHVAGDPDFPEFYRRLTDLLQPLLPRYNREGKSYLTIAIGCTGGRHRSVFVAEKLGLWLKEQGLKVALSHRELTDREPDRAGGEPA